MAMREKRKTAARRERQAKAYEWFRIHCTEGFARMPPWDRLSEKSKRIVMEAYSGRLTVKVHVAASGPIQEAEAHRAG